MNVAANNMLPCTDNRGVMSPSADCARSRAGVRVSVPHWLANGRSSAPVRANDTVPTDCMIPRVNTVAVVCTGAAMLRAVIS